jgi:hypothetical protein
MREEDIGSEPIGSFCELVKLCFNYERLKSPSGKTSRVATW